MTRVVDDAVLEELHALACRLAVEAGRMVRDGRATQGISDATTKSTATDMVTEFDRASEALIVAGLLAARPHDGMVGEEGTATPGTSGIHWLIDPIDGTTNFLYGLPGYGVSIAASTSPSPADTVVGAVYVPATDELFAAAKGRGATLNEAPIRCSTNADLRTALVATGFSYQPERRALQGRRVAALLPQVRDVRRFGAAAPDLCYAAAGRVDVYFEHNLGAWDMAAGVLIATEAGCTAGAIEGGPVVPASVLVANPALFGPMQALIAATDATL